MSAIRKPGRYAWIAVATALILAACDNAPTTTTHARAPAAKKHGIPMIDVTRIDLGTAIGADGRISQQTTVFKPTDTVYAAVTTERPGHGIVLKATWYFDESSLIKEVSQTVSPTDTLVTDFHLVNDAGWPIGRYKIEIQVDGQIAAVTEYNVRQ